MSEFLKFTQEKDAKKKTVTFNGIKYDKDGNETERKTYLTYNFETDTLTLRAKNVQFATEALDVDKLK